MACVGATGGGRRPGDLHRTPWAVLFPTRPPWMGSRRRVSARPTCRPPRVNAIRRCCSTPLFTWQTEGTYQSFSFFQLVNARRRNRDGPSTTRGFDAWPFYFSRDTGVPATSYRALFPIGGTIKDRLGYDRLHFVLFPFYLQTEVKGARVTHAPWPFLRFIDGEGHHGFEFWPLFGRRGRAGDYDSQFYLWPLIYKSSNHLSDPQPDVKLGSCPFTRATPPPVP